MKTKKIDAIFSSKKLTNDEMRKINGGETIVVTLPNGDKIKVTV